MKIFMHAIYWWFQNNARTLTVAIICGFVISPFVIESGGSTVYILGKVRCPIARFEVDATLGVYPEIVCEGDTHLSAVEESFFTESFISRNFRRFSIDDLQRVSRKVVFVCRKIQSEALTIVNLYMWKTEFTITSYNFGHCEQTQTVSVSLSGEIRCKAHHRRCLV